MKINHDSIFDTDKIAKTYSEKDGVPVSYVCTTDLDASDRPLDIFYRSTPHPKFHNRYFGIYCVPHIAQSLGLQAVSQGHVVITNADVVESYDFGMIEDKDGGWWYSQSHHDYREINGKVIDGGRVYVRGSGFEIYKIIDGQFLLEPANELKVRKVAKTNE